MLNIEIGFRLKALREKSGRTQKDVANVLGVTPAAYGKIEAGDRGLSSEYCIQLADLYGVTCDYILRGVEAKNIDICARTGLEQETIEALEKNTRFAPEEESDDLYVRRWMKSMQIHLINALIQSANFLPELSFEAVSYCVCLKSDFAAHFKDGSDAPLEVKALGIQRTLNACLFSASECFNRFFSDFCSDSDLICAFAKLTDEEKEICFKLGLFNEV